MRTTRVLQILFAVSVGLAFGVGAYTFVYARGGSYLTNDPAACANCHVMLDYYTGWLRSSHHGVAVCNDCHTSAGFFPKYAVKVSNGFWHSYAFTSGRFPEPLQIKQRNREVAEASCRKCHQEIVLGIEGTHPRGETLSCVRCHGTVGHPN